LKRVTLVLLLISLLAAACGDKKETNASATGKSTTTTVDGQGAAPNGGSTTTTTAKGSKGTKGTTTTSTTKPGDTTGGTTGASTTTTTRAPFPVKMSLEKTCVRRGSTGDTQALHVTTRPKDFVGYSTEYSDHSNELSNQSYKTGSGYQDAGEDGKVTIEWKLPDNAPTGTATLHTIADGRLQPVLTFKVVSALDHC
jgi:hypothetical protein